jgi:hypothetical protein
VLIAGERRDDPKGARVQPQASGSGLRSRLGEVKGGAALGPFAALLKKFDTLEALEDAAFGADVAGFLEAGVLGHD